MESPSEIVLRETLQSPSEELWLTTWRRVADEYLTERARSLLDLDRCVLHDNWLRLDEPRYRRKVVPRGAPTWERCADLLLPHLGILNQSLERQHLPKFGKMAMRQMLVRLFPYLAASDESDAVFCDYSIERLWPFLGHAIGRTLYHHNTPKLVEPEWRILNQLLLSGFFISCCLPTAALVRQSLEDTERTLLSTRGSLIRIVERVSEQGIHDSIPPICTHGVDGITLRHESLSELLSGTGDESRKIALGQGFLHILSPLDNPSDVPPEEWGSVTFQQLRRGRDASYRLYENTVLSYLALASIEQLLRAWASHNRIQHFKPNGVPAGVLDWLGSLKCSSELHDHIRDLYDAKRPNIRNRLMHGNMMEIISGGLATRLAAHNPARYSALAGGPFSPENVAHLCLQCLQRLDTEVADSRTLHTTDLGWMTSLALDRSEIEFGLRLHVDFLSDDRQKWVTTMADYLNATFPALRQLFIIGLVGWMRTGSIPAFMGVAFVFEALYRLTVHLLGKPVLQVSRARSDGSLKAQYKMLDARSTGICTPAILAALVDHVESPVDQQTASRVLLLAIKARNAFAHGAISLQNQETADGIGHLFVKAAQILVTRAMHHMVRERAYYTWVEQRHFEHGHDVEDWDAARDETLRMISRVAHA